MKFNCFLLFCSFNIFILSCGKQTIKQPEELPNTKPNIIFIMVDDLGYGDLGSFGQKEIKTPAIDKMAIEGTRFTHVYAGSPVCAPSRSTLMTGQHTGHTKVRGNTSAIEIPELPLPKRIPLAKEDVTIAELLKMKGYVTGMFGKWGLGEATTSGEPNAKGFDEWFGFNNQRQAHNHYPEYVWHNRDTFLIEANRNEQQGQHVHELFSEYAFKFLEMNKDTSFFMYLPYTLPHDKFHATDEFKALYTDKNWTEQAQTYAAMISMVDADVKRLMEKLKEYGITEKTLVFFCSDNGAANRYDGVFDSSGKLKGRKRDMYEGGIRTPMITWMPGTVPAGKVSDYPWYFPDVLPTICEFTKIQAPKNIDGISVLPALLGEEIPESDRFMYWEFHEKQFAQAVRWKNWKAVKVDGNPLEIYDLSVDEGEKNNIADTQPEIVEKFNTYLATARTPSIYWPVEEITSQN
ncbi:MAG: arylsulfatase [Bacteroidota bacterium]